MKNLGNIVNRLFLSGLAAGTLAFGSTVIPTTASASQPRNTIYNISPQGQDINDPDAKEELSRVDAEALAYNIVRDGLSDLYGKQITVFGKETASTPYFDFVVNQGSTDPNYSTAVYFDPAMNDLTDTFANVSAIIIDAGDTGLEPENRKDDKYGLENLGFHYLNLTERTTEGIELQIRDFFSRWNVVSAQERSWGEIKQLYLR